MKKLLCAVQNLPRARRTFMLIVFFDYTAGICSKSGARQFSLEMRSRAALKDEFICRGVNSEQEMRRKMSTGAEERNFGGASGDSLLDLLIFFFFNLLYVNISSNMILFLVYAVPFSLTFLAFDICKLVGCPNYLV